MRCNESIVPFDCQQIRVERHADELSHFPPRETFDSLIDWNHRSSGCENVTVCQKRFVVLTSAHAANLLQTQSLEGKWFFSSPTAFNFIRAWDFHQRCSPAVLCQWTASVLSSFTSCECFDTDPKSSVTTSSVNDYWLSPHSFASLTTMVYLVATNILNLKASKWKTFWWFFTCTPDMISQPDSLLQGVIKESNSLIWSIFRIFHCCGHWMK